MTNEHLDAYRKIYKLRLAQGTKTNTIEVTFPYQVVEKEARKHNITVSEFIESYQAVASYNGFEGVNYTFEKNKNDK